MLVLFIRVGYFATPGVHSAGAACVQNQAHAIHRFGFVTPASDVMSSGIPALPGEASDDPVAYGRAGAKRLHAATAIATRMKFHWWWILIAIAVIWFCGWLVTVVMGVFFNPLDSDEDRRKNFQERLLSNCVINLFLWPAMLPSLLERRKFLREIRTGKRPGWIVMDKGEESGRVWHLSDGTEFSAFVSTAGDSSEPAAISADYEDDSLTGEIRYRLRMIAPTAQPSTEWRSLRFTARGPQPDPDDEEAVDDYTADRYEASVKLARGKYEVAFQVPNRAGKVEECSSVILIVSDSSDYDL